MSNGLSYRYGGLHLLGARSQRYGLFITETSGWIESVKAVYDEVPVPGGNGSFDVPVYLSSRLVRAKGFCKAESFETLDWFHGAVTGQLGGEATRPFVAEHLGATEWAMGQCVRADFTPLGGQLRAEWQMDFWMPKPEKFGDIEVFGEGEAAEHRGNTGAPPVFTITGIRPAGYTIHGPGGRVLKVTRPLAAGSTHVYDMATSELLVDGALVDGGVEIPGSWALPRGARWTHTITGGTGTFQTTITRARV